MEQLGCWLTPACQTADGQAAKLLHHFVVHPMVDGLSVEQTHGLDVPPFGHWWAVNIHTYKLTFLILTDDSQKVIKRSVLRLANCPENEMRLDENNL